MVTGAVLGESARGVGASVSIDAREMRQLRTVSRDDPICGWPNHHRALGWPMISA